MTISQHDSAPMSHLKTSFKRLGSHSTINDEQRVVGAGEGSPLPRGLARSSRSRDGCRRVSIVVIDKSALFRAGLKHILAGTRFRVIADYPALRDLPKNTINGKPCVLLIGLDREGAIAVFPQLSSLALPEQNRLRVILLTEVFRVSESLAAIEAGADGYLVKTEISPETLLKSLELVLEGNITITQGLTKLLRSGTPPAGIPAVNCLESVSSNGHALPDGDAAQTDDFRRLSIRERMILSHLMQGASNKHIARTLNIAEATVKVHVKSLLRKIRVNNRTQAAIWATDHLPLADRLSASDGPPPGGRTTTEPEATIAENSVQTHIMENMPRAVVSFPVLTYEEISKAWSDAKIDESGLIEHVNRGNISKAQFAEIYMDLDELMADRNPPAAAAE
jgi:two-component system, NarL family, nitrate/nitrite response regulator NarL